MRSTTVGAATPVVNPLATPWQNRDTIRMCEHVVAHGAQQWEALAEPLMYPPELCALKCHVLVLENTRPNMAVKVPKWWSDWELCALLLACETGAELGKSKASVYAAMAGWIPGRSVAGLKQAHSANTGVVDGRAKVLSLLQAHGWPSDLVGLMRAWPGPHEAFQVRSLEEDQALATDILRAFQQQGFTDRGSRLPHHTSVPAATSTAQPAQDMVQVATVAAVTGSTSALSLQHADRSTGDLNVGAGFTSLMASPSLFAPEPAGSAIGAPPPTSNAFLLSSFGLGPDDLRAQSSVQPTLESTRPEISRLGTDDPGLPQDTQPQGPIVPPDSALEMQQGLLSQRSGCLPRQSASASACPVPASFHGQQTQHAATDSWYFNSGSVGLPSATAGGSSGVAVDADAGLDRMVMPRADGVAGTISSDARGTNDEYDSLLWGILEQQSGSDMGGGLVTASLQIRPLGNAGMSQQQAGQSHPQSTEQPLARALAAQTIPEQHEVAGLFRSSSQPSPHPARDVALTKRPRVQLGSMPPHEGHSIQQPTWGGPVLSLQHLDRLRAQSYPGSGQHHLPERQQSHGTPGSSNPALHQGPFWYPSHLSQQQFQPQLQPQVISDAQQGPTHLLTSPQQQQAAQAVMQQPPGMAPSLVSDVVTGLMQRVQMLEIQQEMMQVDIDRLKSHAGQ